MPTPSAVLSLGMAIPTIRSLRPSFLNCRLRQRTTFWRMLVTRRTAGELRLRMLRAKPQALFSLTPFNIFKQLRSSGSRAARRQPTACGLGAGCWRVPATSVRQPARVAEGCARDRLLYGDGECAPPSSCPPWSCSSSQCRRRSARAHPNKVPEQAVRVAVEASANLTAEHDESLRPFAPELRIGRGLASLCCPEGSAVEVGRTGLRLPGACERRHQCGIAAQRCAVMSWPRK